MTRASVFPGGPLNQLRTLRKHRNYLFSNDGLAAVLIDALGADADFADLALPFGAVAVDAATGLPVSLRSGPLVPAILASSAIPGIYPPVELEGRVLYDGGVLANVPIRQALVMGARSLVVLDCAFPGHLPDVPGTMAETLLFWATLGMRNQALLEAEVAAVTVPVVYLPGAGLRPHAGTRRRRARVDGRVPGRAGAHRARSVRPSRGAEPSGLVARDTSAPRQRSVAASPRRG
jgi:NTE family protein